jgi:16S rRNA (guanine1516-N2)-methyltransferase
VGDCRLDLISVWVEDDAELARATQLAKAIDAPLTHKRPKTKLVLFVHKGKIGFGFSDDMPLRPYHVDFLSLEWRFRKSRGFKANKLFLTAIGIKEKTTVLDASAGFGQDAFLLAWAGAHVTAVERSPVVFALLEDGLQRAFAEDLWKEIGSRISVVQTDSQVYASDHAGFFDVIYLDPMFNKPKKSAKSRKSMQLLQTLLADEKELPLGQFVKTAIEAAKKRVVVKLPLKGDSLYEKPDITFAGQSIRYDVYLKR